MAGLLIHWILSALILLLIAYIVPGFRLRGAGTALMAVIVIGLINATVGLILKIVTFPLTLLTFGLFLIVVNAIVLKIAAWIMPGFAIRGFVPAVVAAILLSLLTLLLRWTLPGLGVA